MSRIGKLPITVPKGVTVTVDDNNQVVVKGPKGTLAQQMNKDITLSQDEGVLTLNRPSDSKPHKALHGLYRSLVHNMVLGVTDGFQKTLLMVGTGYRAQVDGKKLTLNVGYSHPIIFDAPDNVTFETPNATTIVVKGIDKQVVGALAADIRATRPPEPYLGKGIKYDDERIRRKEGKTGSK
ncbi:MAG: 50S ribosomal protein L6 [Christensenellales bacterium]|jgi:large subunit ribosomal protein L6